MKQPSATFLTIALASVSIVEAEEPATRPRIVDVSRVLFEAHQSDAKIDAALETLIGWGLVIRSDREFRVSEAGKSLLVRCGEGARTQREHLESVEEFLKELLTAGSNKPQG